MRSYTEGANLFGTIELTKNADTDKYSYSGYGIGFDAGGCFYFSGVVGLLKMSLYLVLIWAHLHILIIKGKI